jgi:O-antigen/teichoic acid export membrane protein
LFAPVPLTVSVKAYLWASAAVRGLGLFRTVVLAWLLSAAEIGSFQLGLVVANVLLPVASLGLYEGLPRFVPEHESGRLGRFLARSLGLGLLLATGICGLLLLGRAWLEPALLGAARLLGGRGLDGSAGAPPDGGLLHSVCAVVVALTAYHLMHAVLRARRMFRAASAMEMVMAVLFTLLAVLAVLAGLDSGRSILNVYALSSAALAVAAAAVMPWNSGAALDRSGSAGPPAAVRELLYYSVPAGAAALGWQFLLSYPALRLQRGAGPETFGVFDLTRTWTQVGLLASTAVAAPLASAVTREWAGAGPRPALDLLDVGHKLVACALLMGSLVLALGRGAIGLLLPLAYRPGLEAAAVLLCAWIGASAVQLLAIRLMLVKRSGAILVCWAMGSLAATVLAALLIGSGDAARSLHGAAWSTLAGVSVALVCMLAFLARHELLPDRGVLLLIAGGALPLLPAGLLAAALVAIPLCAFGTSILFTSAQRARLASWWQRMARGA